MQNIFNGKSILVTGGTGSFGKAFIAFCLENFPGIRKMIIYSRDELKQFEMMHEAPFATSNDKLRFFIGDVRDGERLRRACEDVDLIVHAAAMKQVPVAEYNPMECINTNIMGAQNVINAALDTKVKRVVALSTDKAAAPINLYGATKLCSDKLFIAANNIRGSRDLRFSVVRYGNVMGSRGSVIPFFMQKKKDGVMPVTHPEMTRFNITLAEGVNLVVRALGEALAGEIYVPKIPSYKILDIVQAIAPKTEVKIVGIRPGEKIHEEMITESDSLNTIDCGPHYIILPSGNLQIPESEYLAHHQATKVQPGFKYNSGTNDQWLSVQEIRQLIRTHVDPHFKE